MQHDTVPDDDANHLRACIAGQLSEHALGDLNGDRPLSNRTPRARGVGVDHHHEFRPAGRPSADTAAVNKASERMGTQERLLLNRI